MAKKQNESLQTKNEVSVVGIVKENKLEVDASKVNGSLVIQYGDAADQQAEVKVYIGRKKADGEDNKNYDKAVDWANNIVSVAKATEDKPASTVRISGKGNFTPSIRLNEFFNDNTKTIVSNVELSLGFSNIYVGDIPKDQFKAQFDMVVYLTKAPTREDKGDTEILNVEGLFVDYKGAVKPVQFVVEDDELIDGIEECEKGSTVNFWGSCKVAQITEVKKKESGFGGKAKTEETVTTIRQLLIEGGDPIDEDDKRAIDSSFIKKALAEREIYLESLANKLEKETKTKTKGGFGGGVSSSKSNDIPF